MSFFQSVSDWAADQERSVRQSVASASTSLSSLTSPSSGSSTSSSQLAASPPDDADVSQLFASMSYKQRLAGFAAAFAFGLFCDFVAVTLFLARPSKFAKLYTLGNLALLLSTLFLVGWRRQLRNMADPSRSIASLVFVLAIFVTLYSAIVLQRVGVTLLCTIVQTSAAVWYGASYIPFMQRCIRSTAQRVMA